MTHFAFDHIQKCLLVAMKNMLQLNFALKSWDHFYKITNNHWVMPMWLWYFILPLENSNNSNTKQNSTI
jgi:hypothetical protein